MKLLTRTNIDNQPKVMGGDRLHVTHKIADQNGKELAVGTYEFDIIGAGRVVAVEREIEINGNEISFTTPPVLVWSANPPVGNAILVAEKIIMGDKVVTPQSAPTETCPDCQGKGKIALFTSIETCSRCHGVGRI